MVRDASEGLGMKTWSCLSPCFLSLLSILGVPGFMKLYHQFVPLLSRDISMRIYFCVQHFLPVQVPGIELGLTLIHLNSITITVYFQIRSCPLDLESPSEYSY